jgi:16S rRNA (adenine1518-N6/adenine1519-N6)-dimethyltransferase
MKAKKSLGQNFLKGEFALRKIIEAGEIKPHDIVLEIGPGKGALTKQLLASGCQLIAIEKDKNLYDLLKIKFEKEIASNQLVLLNEDILQFNFNYKLKAMSYELTDYKLIANIPYNITGAILKKFLTAKNQPKSMVLMVQHEVAKRIIARNPRHGGAGGKESILSISVKAYGEPKLISKVPARYFSPAPKVDSAIIAINNISRRTFLENNIDEEKFWEIVKTAFAHKRKKLGSNLKKSKDIINELFVDSLKNKRAEELTLSDWIKLIQK